VCVRFYNSARFAVGDVVVVAGVPQTVEGARQSMEIEPESAFARWDACDASVGHQVAPPCRLSCGSVPYPDPDSRSAVEEGAIPDGATRPCCDVRRTGRLTDHWQSAGRDAHTMAESFANDAAGLGSVDATCFVAPAWCSELFQPSTEGTQRSGGIESCLSATFGIVRTNQCSDRHGCHVESQPVSRFTYAVQRADILTMFTLRAAVSDVCDAMNCDAHGTERVKLGDLGKRTRRRRVPNEKGNVDQRPPAGRKPDRDR